MSRCYLHRAAASGDIGRIKKLLHQGADVNTEDEQGYVMVFFVTYLLEMYQPTVF